MPELIYQVLVSQQCKDFNCLDCPGRYQVDRTTEGKPVWQMCGCRSCTHSLRVQSAATK